MDPIFFQISAVVIAIVMGLLLFRGGGSKQQALRRIMFLLFVLVAGFSVFFPQAWTVVANLVGIGRGADLLLYLLVLFFLAFVATTFKNFRSRDRQITELARKLALMEASAEQSNRSESA